MKSLLRVSLQNLRLFTEQIGQKKSPPGKPSEDESFASCYHLCFILTSQPEPYQLPYIRHHTQILKLRISIALHYNGCTRHSLSAFGQSRCEAPRPCSKATPIPVSSLRALCDIFCSLLFLFTAFNFLSLFSYYHRNTPMSRNGTKIWK